MPDDVIADWLSQALPGETITGQRVLTGGYSNENVRLTTASGRSYVLRRYRDPRKCAIEAALAARLAGVVPVPEVIAVGEVAGEPVLLSVFVPGAPASSDLPGSARAIGETLAAIGRVTFPAPGFFADGGLVPDGSETAVGLDVFVARCLEKGNQAGHLTAAEQRALLRFAADAAPELEVLRGSQALVHGDFNPKNLLVDGRAVAAALDWEFAFSGSPLFDIGNMLRDPRPSGFEAAFLAGFRDGGGDLPPGWRRLSQALDLYSLADFLTRPVDHRYFGRAVTRIRTLLAS